MFKSPLWSLFLKFKSLSTRPLSIDEYFAFITAMHQLPLSETIKNERDLLKICKLFWLKKESEYYLLESCFKEIFNANLWDWEEMKKEIDQPQETPKVEKTEKEEVSDTPKVESKGKEEKNTENKKEEEQQAVQQQEWEDIELYIGDSNQQAVAENQQVYFNHIFNLWDQTIMPFDLRYFAQRLRRRVETSTYETTDELDIPKMIEIFSRNGYLNELHFTRRTASNSNVVLLADRRGSMLAYDYWERQLQQAFKSIPACNFEHYSFYNLPKKKKDSKHYLLNTTDRSSGYFDSEKNNWNENTWFFIFSDAGAHSGIVNSPRIGESIDLWYYLKEFSKNTYWLNPVHLEDQNDCTARRLTFSIPMIYPDKTGLNKITKRKVNA